MSLENNADRIKGYITPFIVTFVNGNLRSYTELASYPMFMTVGEIRKLENDDFNELQTIEIAGRKNRVFVLYYSRFYEELDYLFEPTGLGGV